MKIKVSRVFEFRIEDARSCLVEKLTLKDFKTEMMQMANQFIDEGSESQAFEMKVIDSLVAFRGYTRKKNSKW